MNAGLRFERLDALRGLAMLWMAAFHFCFDLNHFGLIQQNFYDNPIWTMQRSAIVALFLFCAGFAQALAMAHQQSRLAFARRWLQIAGCALLVSIGSWFMFPESFITFGVLHGIAVMLLLARAAAPLGRLLWPLGLLALLLPLWLQHPWFDSRTTNWIGFVTFKPKTEDYVPLLPWLGIMLWGMAAGHWAIRQPRHRLTAPLPNGLRGLTRLGRWPLRFYMLHQPVLIGLLLLYQTLR